MPSNTLRIISVEVSLVEIETSLPIRFVLSKENEIMLIQKEENMTKVQAKNKKFYYELINEPNVDIIVITVYMWKDINLKLYLLLMMF